MSISTKLQQRFETPAKAVSAIIVAVVVVQLLGATRLGFGVDEAHYALYGRFPAWSYFDHPPMVGWLQWLMLHIGDSELILRLLPIAMLAASAAALYGLCIDLYPQRSHWTAVLAVLAMQSMIMIHLIGLGMIPDGPLLLVGLLAMRVFVRISRGGSGGLWLLLGLLLGLAALSKYTAATLVISAALILPIFQRWRELAKPWLWLGAIIALLLCVPILIWNLQNDWISLSYQIDHGTGSTTWSLTRFVQTQAGQLVVYSPPFFVLGWLCILATLKNWRQAADGDKLSLIFALPILLLFGISGGLARGLPHWPALGWVAVIPLLISYIQDRWQHARSIRIAVRCSLAYSALALLLLHSLAHLPVNPFPEYAHPMQDLIGWKDGARHAQMLQKQMQAEFPAAEPVIFTRRWTHASRLAWYNWPEPLIVLSPKNKQFHIWYGEPQLQQNGVLVVYERRQRSAEQAAAGLLDWFDSIELIDTLPVQYSGKTVATFFFFQCFGLKNSF